MFILSNAKSLLAKCFLLTIFIFTFTAIAYPCKCVKAGLKTHYKNANAVVLGKVLEKKDLDENITEVNIQITNYWKLKMPKTLTLLIEKSSCEYGMMQGETHLLYLEKLESGKFTTNSCSGNMLEIKSQKAKLWLKKYANK